MTRNLSSDIETAAAERGSVTDEILLGLVKATEEQTNAIKELTKAVIRLSGPPYPRLQAEEE